MVKASKNTLAGENLAVYFSSDLQELHSLQPQTAFAEAIMDLEANTASFSSLIERGLLHLYAAKIVYQFLAPLPSSQSGPRNSQMLTDALRM